MPVEEGVRMLYASMDHSANKSKKSPNYGAKERKWKQNKTPRRGGKESKLASEEKD